MKVWTALHALLAPWHSVLAVALRVCRTSRASRPVICARTRVSAEETGVAGAASSEAAARRTQPAQPRLRSSSQTDGGHGPSGGASTQSAGSGGTSSAGTSNAGAEQRGRERRDRQFDRGRRRRRRLPRRHGPRLVDPTDDILHRCLRSHERAVPRVHAGSRSSEAPAQGSSCSGNSTFLPDSQCSTALTDIPSRAVPVVCVDWCDAAAYCASVGKRLCGRIGGTPNPQGDFRQCGRLRMVSPPASAATRARR